MNKAAPLTDFSLVQITALLASAKAAIMPQTAQATTESCSYAMPT